MKGHHRRRAPQAKKHKTWQGDGVLVVTRPKAVLMDLEGRVYALDLFSNFVPQTEICALDLQLVAAAPMYLGKALN